LIWMPPVNSSITGASGPMTPMCLPTSTN